ncbi:MAG: FtsX-like permease family protein [Pseudomonadota bacterium]
MNRKFSTILQALLSHWQRKPLQLVTFIGGLALATALWSGVQAVNSEARKSYDAAAATLGEGQFDQLVPRVGNTIPLVTYIKLRRNGWLVSPVIEGQLNGIRIVGVDALTSPGELPDLQLSDNTPLQDFLGKGTIYANQETALALNISVPVQISSNVAPGIAITDISVAQDILAREDLTRLMVANTHSLNREELAVIAPDLRLQPSQQSADLGELTESFHLNLTAFGLLSFAVGIFIVHSTIGLAFEQRRATLRTLRALGVSLISLIIAVIFEIFTLAIFGATIGILLGYFVAAALLPDVASTLSSLYGAHVAGTLQLRAEWWLSGYAMALFGTVVAITGKLWQIASMPILVSAQPRAWAMTVGRGRTLQAIIALLLISGALALLGFGKGLVAGFAMLGCLLLGAALALPTIIEKCLGFVQGHVRGVISQWFLADTRQQIPGLSLALMALLLAIAANIGVSTMVSSFRQTFVEFLDQRLAPELFVRIEDLGKSAAVEAALTANADEVLLLYSRKASVRGIPVEIDGIRVGKTYRDNWRLLAAEEKVWDRLATGEVIIANEQFARRAGYWVGDIVSFAGKDLLLGGVAGDYGNPLGQIILGEKLYRELYPDDRAFRFGARTTDQEALKMAVQAQTGLPDSAFTNQADIKSFSLQVFERTFAVTAALNVLTLVVAGFAMFTSLLTLADLRVPQLAPVWALGLSRRELGKLEVLRTLVFAAVVCVLALPLGLALAWILLSVINVEAFGWRLPMFLFPADYAQLLAYALLAAFLAALWPAIRLARIAPNTLLKVFAHER